MCHLLLANLNPMFHLPPLANLNPMFHLPPLANLNPMCHTQHCVTTMAAPAWTCKAPEGEDEDAGEAAEGGGVSTDGRAGPDEGGGLSFLLKQEDTEAQDAYIHLFNRMDVAVREMKQYVAQIDV